MDTTNGDQPGNGASAVCAEDLTAGSRIPEGVNLATIELFGLLALLRARWRIILVASFTAALITFLVARFLLTHIYQAMAVITPVSPSASMGSQVGSVLNALGGGALQELSGIAEGSDQVMAAQRYMSIMKSFAFTNSLIDRYHLAAKIAERGGLTKNITPWSLYETASDDFDCDYDYKSGNLELYYTDPDPEQATKMLTYYIDSLREKLRGEEVQSAAQAVASLKDEAGKTPDALLQTQLYELMARQIQREKLAQMQADFAFKMVEPPVAPDRPYAPHPVRYAAAVGAVTLVLMCSFFVFRVWLRRIASQLPKAEPAPRVGPPNREAPLGDVRF